MKIFVYALQFIPNIKYTIIPLMPNKKYIVVGGPRISGGQIQYRRTRLMTYLANVSSDNEVYWVYSENGRLRDIGQVVLEKIELDSGRIVTSIGVCDWHFLIGRGFLSRLVRSKVSKIIGSMGVNDALIYTLPRFATLVNLFKKCKVIYDVSDNWVGQYRKISVKSLGLKLLLGQIENTICKRAETVFASSLFIKKEYEHKYAINVTLAQNGVDYLAISSSPMTQEVEKRAGYAHVIGFSGSLLNREKNKIDLELLLLLATSRPEWLFIIIGPYDQSPVEKVRLLRQCPNVRFLGFIDPLHLGGFIKGFDLALLPYLRNDFTAGIFPIKLYEYIACGVPIVSVNLPSTQKISEVTRFYKCVDNKDQFLSACDLLLTETMNDQEKEDYRELAKRSDWANVFKTITASLGQ